MSLRSELDAMHKQRDREVAIKAALKKMDAAEVKENSNPPAGEVMENGTAETDLVLHPYDESTNTVARVVAPEKPWMRGNRQWRPMNSRERQQEQDERMDAKALADLQAYRDEQQASYDGQKYLDAEQARRTEREIRTGLRFLPGEGGARGSGERFISMEEARERGLL